MALIENISEATQKLQQVWTGADYMIASTDYLDTISTAEISTVSFSASTIEYLECGSLSTRKRQFPVREIPGLVTLKGMVISATNIYDLYQNQVKFVDGLVNNEVQSLSEVFSSTLVLTCWSNIRNDALSASIGDRSIVGGVAALATGQLPQPVAIIVMEQCQPISWKFGEANANATSMSIEEVVLKPYKLHRISA
jgi:hypothetical protein